MLLTPEIADLVGAAQTYVAPERIGRASMRYFAAAIGDDNPIYTDEEAALAAGYEEVVAPVTFVCETNQYMSKEPDAEGYAGHTWGIEVPGTRVVRGGHEYRFHRPLYPSDRLTVAWVITDITEKQQSSGKAMLIVTSEARFENQDGALLAENRETLIYMEV